MDSQIQKAVPSPGLSSQWQGAAAGAPTQTTPNPSSQAISHHGIAPSSRALSVLGTALAWHPGVLAEHLCSTLGAHTAECPCGIQSLGHGGSLGVPAPAAEHPSHPVAVGRANPCYPNKQQMGILPFPPTSIMASAGSRQEADPIMPAHPALLVTLAPSYFRFVGGFFRPAKELEDFLEL